jgi:hypothetical protein
MENTLFTDRFQILCRIISLWRIFSFYSYRKCGTFHRMQNILSISSIVRSYWLREGLAGSARRGRLTHKNERFSTNGGLEGTVGGGPLDSSPLLQLRFGLKYKNKSQTLYILFYVYKFMTYVQYSGSGGSKRQLTGLLDPVPDP